MKTNRDLDDQDRLGEKGHEREQIVGQDAQCYHYKNNQTNETSDTCFSNDGIPLYDKTDSGTETTTVEATAINSGVQSSDFTLPYEVKDLPDLGDSTTTP